VELYHTAEELMARLEESGFKGNTLTLKVKFHDFTQITRSITQEKVLTSMKSILPLAKKLLANVEYENHPIRLLGLSVSNPHDGEDDSYRNGWEQLELKFKEY
jgi:DNA polymerase-4